MKSTSYRGIAGNAKLRGKLSCTLSCRCCDLFNFKPKMLKQLAEKEAREAKSSKSDPSQAYQEDGLRKFGAA